MNYADIKQYDVANGPGIRVSLFVSGCTHHCKGCFNEVTWDFNYGQEFTKEQEDNIIEFMKPDYVSGFTLLGGEPFEYVNQKGVLPLLKRIKETYPQKNIWCFSGYDFEKDILQTMAPKWPETMEMLSQIDILVDGEFKEDLKDLSLRFKGSSNQRTILVQESLAAKEVILWDPTTDTI